jgi:hypothetical protein
MLFQFAPVKYRTSGPKGHKDDDIYAGDKSPAYPRDDFSSGLPVLVATATVAIEG